MQVKVEASRIAKRSNRRDLRSKRFASVLDFETSSPPVDYASLSATLQWSTLARQQYPNGSSLSISISGWLIKTKAMVPVLLELTQAIERAPMS